LSCASAAARSAVATRARSASKAACDFAAFSRADRITPRMLEIRIDSATTPAMPDGVNIATRAPFQSRISNPIQ